MEGTVVSYQEQELEVPSMPVPQHGGNPVDQISRTVAIDLSHVRKSFAARNGERQTVAIDDTSLTVHSGEFIVLLGPSGCGKTTLLRCIAGLEQPDQGDINIFGRTVFSDSRKIFVPPEDRGISMVFQSYALWPHMSVGKNVGYPLKYGRGPKISTAEIREKVDNALSLVGIGGMANRYPHQMSGGQQQRVALARALVGGAKVILFDEPLSNVDAKVREQLRAEILEMQSTIGFTAFYVTHDQAEAMQMADRVAVIDKGRVLQLGSSRDVYTRPRTRDTANFVGTMNEVPGAVHAIADGGFTVRTELGDIVAANVVDGFARGDEVVVAWRPERGILGQGAPPQQDNTWQGSVTMNHFVGAYTEHVVQVGGQTVKHWSHDQEVPAGSQVWLHVQPANLHVFPAGVRHDEPENP